MSMIEHGVFGQRHGIACQNWSQKNGRIGGSQVKIIKLCTPVLVLATNKSGPQTSMRHVWK